MQFSYPRTQPRSVAPGILRIAAPAAQGRGKDELRGAHPHLKLCCRVHPHPKQALLQVHPHQPQALLQGPSPPQASLAAGASPPTSSSVAGSIPTPSKPCCRCIPTNLKLCCRVHPHPKLCCSCQSPPQTLLLQVHHQALAAGLKPSLQVILLLAAATRATTWRPELNPPATTSAGQLQLSTLSQVR
jgi:hypothetical protein